MDIWNGPWSPHASHHGGYFEAGEAEPAGQPEAGPSNYQQRAQLNEVHPPVDNIEHDSRSNNGGEPQRQPNLRQRSSNSVLSLDAGKAREKRSIPTEGRDIPGEDDEDDEEEQVCRICRCGPEPDQPLFHPCKCTGSIRYTHQDCLKDWLSHSRKDKCELCDYPFVFRKIYDAHMPSKLPGGLRAAFFAKKSGQFAIVALRALLVVAIWLALVPWALIKFFKGSLWIVDLLIAAAGGGSSTWTNVSSGALTSASEALFSSSAPAAPSPTAMPPRPSAPSLALTFSGQALIGSVISFGFYATPWAGLGGGVSLLLDWALRAERAGLVHDIFLGQVLTCVIIVLLLAGWFTREWIVMQMPAPLPEQLRDEREEEGLAQPAVQDMPPPPLALPQVPQEGEAAGPQPHGHGPHATNDLVTYDQLMAELERRSAEMSAQMDEEQRQWLDGDAEAEDAAEGSHAAQQEQQRGMDSGEEQADGPASIEELRRARLAAFGRSPANQEEPINVAGAGSPARPVEEPDFEPDYARRLLAANEYRAPRAGRRAPDIATDSDTATEGDHLGDAQDHEPLLAGPNPADVRFALAAFQERAAAGQQNGNAAAAAVQEAAAAAEAEAAADAADAADFDGDVDGMLEAIGFRGDPSHLLANVSIVVALCSFCIIVGVTMPYLLGRVFGLGKGFLDVVTAPVRMIRWVTDPVFDAAINLVMGKGDAAQEDNVESSMAQVWQQLVKLVQPSTASTTAPGPTPTPFISAVSALLQKMRTLPVDIVQPIEERLVRADASIANRALCVGVGHFWWMGQIALRVVFEEVMKRRHPRPEWWLREFIGQVLVVVKVLVFLAIELILFPIGCGLILDACTLPFRGITLSTALAAPLLKPLSFTYMRWAVGTLWMFRIGLYVSHIRSLVRPGVMSWIRDPEDPDFQPIKEILERKSFTQLRKIGTSAVMYASLILALVGFNVHLAHWMWKDVLPLRLPQRSLAPYDFLAVLFLVPVANPERLEDALAWVSRKWWRAAAGALRLDGYFFGDFPTTTTTTDVDYKIRGTPTFLARIPASDNAIIGTPPLIYLDGKTGEAISERGKEAIRDQEAKIRAMPEPKAKYVSVRLPTNFARRVRALLVLLWASMSVGLHALLGALVLGRRVLENHEGREGQLHDGYAFAAGCATLALPATVAWSLYTIIGTIKRKRNAALKLRRAARKAAGLMWLIVALGFVSPALLGIAIDQVILSHLRASTTQTSLLYAWSLGLLTQELYVQCLDWLPQDGRISAAVQELQRRGLRRLRVWPATRDIFLPIAASSLAAIVAPLVISAAVNASTAITSPGKETEALYLGRLVVLAAGLAVLGVRLVAAHLERFDRELRDEVYLRISQLRNYKGTSRGRRRGGGHGHGRRRGQRQWVPEDDEPMSEDSGSVSGSATGADADEAREEERFDDIAADEVQNEEEEETGDETLGDWEETEEADEVEEIQ